MPTAGFVQRESRRAQQYFEKWDQFATSRETHKLLPNVFGKYSRKSLLHSMQKDSNNCGIFVCFFAKLLAIESADNFSNLMIPTSRIFFSSARDYIWRTIKLNCTVGISASSSFNDCKFCGEASETSSSWIQCDLCDAWIHSGCASREMLQRHNSGSFVACCI